MVARSALVAVPLLLLCTSVVHAEQMRGVVTSLDLDKKELVLEGRGIGKRGKSFTFVLGKDLAVTWGDMAAGAADVCAGQNIRITYESKDGDSVAVQIQIQGRRPAAKPKVDGDRVTGLLRRVGLTDREIVVASPGPGNKETYTTLPVADDAKIMRDGKEIAFDDLKEEERVSVKVEVRKEKKVAVVIEVGVPGKAMEAKPDEPSKLAKVRLILKIADTILEGIEKRQQKKE
jgi:hypothetical protein